MADGTFTAAGSTDPFELGTGRAVVALEGDYAGGEVQLERQHASGAWQMVASFTDADDPLIQALDALGKSTVRLTYVGGGSPNLNWELTT